MDAKYLHFQMIVRELPSPLKHLLAPSCHSARFRRKMLDLEETATTVHTQSANPQFSQELKATSAYIYSPVVTVIGWGIHAFM
ncbi:hypothetical protein P5673_014970 [Acropora cervicornis]|uniref:Uncharacterized protein n=1 Tax=Acropora cervicornis TaxID=6130 RepID=A0AAD9QJR9_ACRCE|nr:hypothetical protein P5673_014970 [Acropora cervicornis]